MSQRIKVLLDFRQDAQTILVGELLAAASGQIFFQYDKLFLEDGRYSISPLKLKPSENPQSALGEEASHFSGLFGVFSDSLPDGWGLMLMNRALKERGKDIFSISALDRLSYMGHRAMGALVYEPYDEEAVDHDLSGVALSRLADDAKAFLSGNSREVLSVLYNLGGSPGGARPKVLVGYHPDPKKGSPMLSGAPNPSRRLRALAREIQRQRRHRRSFDY